MFFSHLLDARSGGEVEDDRLEPILWEWRLKPQSTGLKVGRSRVAAGQERLRLERLKRYVGASQRNEPAREDQRIGRAARVIGEELLGVRAHGSGWV